ncbi:MAG TPA: hypothetical protein VLW65_22575 [Bryobacteraceae bacterium]|nr:hypothetical protein [Bryobacteraceae bacterium]
MKNLRLKSAAWTLILATAVCCGISVVSANSQSNDQDQSRPKAEKPKPQHHAEKKREENNQKAEPLHRDRKIQEHPGCGSGGSDNDHPQKLCPVDQKCPPQSQ